jgi:hypothetical protein
MMAGAPHNTAVMAAVAAAFPSKLLLKLGCSAFNCVEATLDGVVEVGAKARADPEDSRAIKALDNFMMDIRFDGVGNTENLFVFCFIFFQGR